MTDLETIDLESLATVTGGRWFKGRNINLGPLGSIHIATKAEMLRDQARAAQWRAQGERLGVIR